MIKNQQSPFENYALEYDRWFDCHAFAYQSELEAIKRYIPTRGLGVEIGTGTGRFSEPFSISIGVEPSKSMADIAESRGITVHNTKADNLPFCKEHFDFALMVTTFCFLENPNLALKNIHRILKNKGQFIIGIIDKNSELGKIYESMKELDKYYRHANFYSVNKVFQLLEESGFQVEESYQTIFTNPKTMTAPDPVIDGYGRGAFVVINTVKSSQKMEYKE